MLMTIVSRASDALILSGSSDDSPEIWRQYKQNANTVLRNLDPQYESFEIEVADRRKFLGLVHDDLCYMALFDNNFSSRLGFVYLNELKEQFEEHHLQEAKAAKRAFQVVEFSRTISKLKQKFQEQKSQENLDELVSNIQEIQTTMHKNIRELAQRGEKLDTLSSLSSSVSSQSRKMFTQAKRLNSEAWWRLWGPRMAVVFVVVIFLLWRVWALFSG